MSYKDHFDKDKYIKELEGLIKYQYAYDILMDYFDEWDSETKFLVHLKLKELGL